MDSPWIPLGVFAACYVLFVAWPQRRSAVACAGALILGLTGYMGWRDIFLQQINWNVIGLFFGTLVLAELFMQSRMPGVLAEYLVDKTRTMRGALMVICALSAGMSMFLENVAVVLLIAPIALSLAEKLKISPVRLLIAVAVMSNLEGTATLIGDPPSMILAGYMKLSFNDFFLYRGRPAIFFAVQAGAVAALAVTLWLFRRHRQSSVLVPVETLRSRVPTFFLLALILGLSTTSFFDPDFRWLAGTLTLVLAALALLWFRFHARWGSVRRLIRTLDWDTTFFLMGVFVVVGALGESGWLDRLAVGMVRLSGGSALQAYVLIIVLSVIVSGFVDNVPFLLAMIPVSEKIAASLDVSQPLLLFGLLIGACLGGNLTPIGASANVVSIGLLRKRGYLVTFREFMAVGVPFTAAAVLAAAVFLWFVWGP